MLVSHQPHRDEAYYAGLELNWKYARRNRVPGSKVLDPEIGDEREIQVRE
jgi:hypothetical protein